MSGCWLTVMSHLAADRVDDEPQAAPSGHQDNCDQRSALTLPGL